MSTLTHHPAANRALPAVILGVIGKVGEVGGQRIACPLAFERVCPKDPSENRYRPARRWFKAGKVPGYQADTGTIIVTDPVVEAISLTLPQKIAIYTRVSAAEHKDNLEGQAKRLADYCAAKGYQVVAVVGEE